MPTRSLLARAGRLAAILFLVAQPVVAQHAGVAGSPDKITALRETLAKEGYIEPTADIAKLITAPRHLVVALTTPSPDRKWFLREQSEGLPSVQTYGKQHIYLGGLQVDPKANRTRIMTARGAAGLQLIDSRTGNVVTLETPKGATVSAPVWSPDSKKVAYIANFDAASFVFVADIATGKSVQVAKQALLATLVTTVDWTADGKSIVAVFLPEKRDPMPKKPEIATGPQVRLWTEGTKAPERNYWSLMSEPYEFALFEWLTRGQLGVIDIAKKTVAPIGVPVLFSSVNPSPDGKYFRVSTIQKPFSYVVQYTAFGTRDAVWDAEGRMLAEISKRAIRFAGDTTGGPGGRGGAAGGKKGLAWMPQGDGFYYIAQDSAARGDSARAGGAAGAPAGGPPAAGGRGGAAAGRPEKVVQWLPPFGEKDIKVLYQHTTPIVSAVFTDDAQTLFVATNNAGTGEIFAVKLAEPTKRMTVVRQRGWTPAFAGGGRAAAFGGGGPRGGTDDTTAFYNNPGAMVTKRGAVGGEVALVSAAGEVFLKGTQYARDYLANAPKDFLDKVELASGKKTRVFEGAKDAAETLGALLDDDGAFAVVTRESPTAVPNAYLKDLKTGAVTPLTKNVDPAPDFTALQRKRVIVTRADGIKFVVRLTLPANYQAGTRLPGMFWFYPYEYTDQAGYDRTLRTENVNRFPASGPRTIEFLATQGYAVANFDPPIIGDAGRMNDNYVSDLRMNLYAVIDELDRQGFIDRQKLGLGGHSYGAFSTLNAMVNTPYFKAGIAGDGMYNRTLTPTGFQSERRDLWSGQKTYLDMSPMLNADKLQGALLMYHSLEDQNVGTDPVSSIRMMQALRANGKTASLFMYPYEDHGPVTKETLLDQWARWTTWLDLYVKNDGMALAKKKPAVQP
ncbi:MAG: prolyl oligopeptidase family serine peptidase [Gemmatimonadota bacterium]|nr:prolyl oligopeptidase family serine peptidase [Gemmatimonadota bacterium]